jgi:hypothetical protein
MGIIAIGAGVESVVQAAKTAGRTADSSNVLHTAGILQIISVLVRYRCRMARIFQRFAASARASATALWNPS